MEFFAKRVANGIYAWDAGNQEELERIPRGKMLLVRVSSPRNVDHLKLYWALCQRIASGIGLTKEGVDRVIKYKTGYFDMFKMTDGTDVVQLRSISFNKMEEEEFRHFFESAVQVAYNEFGIEPDAINDLLLPKGEPQSEVAIKKGYAK